MRKIFFALLFCVAMLLCNHNPVNAQTSIIPELSDTYITKLVETARQHYPRVKSLGSRIKIAETNLAKAKISYLDEVTLSYIYTPHAGQGTTGVASTNPVSTTTAATTTIGSNYNYFNSIQVGFFFNPANFLIKPQNVKSAHEELRIARNDEAEYLITLRSDIKKLYYVYLERQAELKIQVQNSSSDEETVALVKKRFEKGELTFDEYNKAISASAANTVARIASEVAYLSAKTDLEALLGEKIENIK